MNYKSVFIGVADQIYITLMHIYNYTHRAYAYVHIQSQSTCVHTLTANRYKYVTGSGKGGHFAQKFILLYSSK